MDQAGRVEVGPGEAGRLIVRFPYSPERVAKIKTVAGRRWHPEGNVLATMKAAIEFRSRHEVLDPAS